MVPSGGGAWTCIAEAHNETDWDTGETHNETERRTDQTLNP